MDYSLCKNGNFCLLFKSMFILSRQACFQTKTSPNIISGCILHKTKCLQNFKFFYQNHALTPLEKNQFCGFLKPMFSLFRKACYLYKNSKIIFSRFILGIYDIGIQEVTRGYWGLQGVTRGYTGTQEVTTGYRGLQGVKKGYKGWQGVTGVYKKL